MKKLQFQGTDSMPSVIIPMYEYFRLKHIEKQRRALVAAGLLDWEGYDRAMDSLDEEGREV